MSNTPPTPTAAAAGSAAIPQPTSNSGATAGSPGAAPTPVAAQPTSGNSTLAALYRLFSKAFNLPLLNISRLAWVDYLKGIAILLVVYRHVLIGIQRSVAAANEHGAGLTPVPEYLETANMIFFSFRMPLFFILSGIFISGSLAKRSLGKILGIKFENLMYPYFIWVTLQVTLQIILGSNTNSNRSLIDYTYILYQPRSLDQFWYLPALFNTTAIYLLVKHYLKPPAWGQILLGLALYFLSHLEYFHRISMISDWMEFYFFFALGDIISVYFFQEKTQNFLKSPITLLCITPIFFLTQWCYLSHPFMDHVTESGEAPFMAVALIGCFSMFVLSLRMQIWGVMKFLRIIGYHSLYIYVTHVFVAALVRVALTKFGHIHNPFILLAGGIFFGITIPIIFYNLLIVDGPLWFLFSYKKRKKQTGSPSAKTSLPS